MMMAWAGRYYGDPLMVTREVIQGDPLYPTIFNMVIYAVVLYWSAVVAGEAAGPEGFGREVYTLSTLFYTYESILDSPRTSRIQVALDVPTGLFDHVGIQNNLGKTVGMTCKNFQKPGSMSEVSYTQRMTKVGS